MNSQTAERSSEPAFSNMLVASRPQRVSANGQPTTQRGRDKEQRPCARHIAHADCPPGIDAGAEATRPRKNLTESQGLVEGAFPGQPAWYRAACRPSRACDRTSTYRNLPSARVSDRQLQRRCRSVGQVSDGRGRKLSSVLAFLAFAVPASPSSSIVTPSRTRGRIPFGVASRPLSVEHGILLSSSHAFASLRGTLAQF